MQPIGGKDLIKDMLEYLPAQVMPALLSIIFLPLITRFLSPDEYGYYTLVISVVNLANTTTNWLSISVSRFYYAYSETDQYSSFISSVMISLLSTAVLTAVSLFILLSGLKNTLSGVFVRSFFVAFFLILALIPLDTFLGFLRVRRQIRWYSFFSVLKVLGGWLFGVGFMLLLPYRVEALIMGSFVAVVLTLFFVGPLIGKELIFSIKNYSGSLIMDMLRYSFPLVIGNFAAWILSFSDRYILQIYRGAYEVGIYSVAYRVAESSILLLLSLFAFSFNPLITFVWEKQGQSATSYFLETGTRYYILLCLPAVIGLSVIQKPLLAIFASPDYGDGALIIPWVAFGIFFFGLFQRFGAIFSLHKKTFPPVMALIGTGLINICLNLILVPNFGYRAAAITTTASYVLLLGWVAHGTRKLMVWQFPWQTLLRTGIASAGMGVGIWFIAQMIHGSPYVNILVSIPIGVALFCILLVLTKEIRADELKTIKAVFQRSLKIESLF